MNRVEVRVIRVLIVEDYKLIRVGLHSVLNKDRQIEVIGEAEDGKDAVDFVQHTKPDIVLMDLGLPHVDGIEATRQIKAFDPEIKVIVLTSHEQDEEVIAALAAGANAYCLKDIPSARLIEIVKAVDEGAAWLDPAIAKVALGIFNRLGNSSRHVNGVAHEILKLSDRELRVLQLLVQGKSNSDIAEELYVSVHTVKSHVGSILQKLCVDDRVQAAVKAIREGLV